ncbi:U3 small nucleolar RNA-interacting protein 2 [Cimex lectularius]|uniref:U3 small nucleolar RNA-interacting protein 2 n=1 Tax=Cimex lectularius TaxID=79782 RepID=A0A8I6S8E7_CIMLE|nr:U3 small nucleolar RNA-interacting protein 2 [Cimex lectularius]
MSSNFFIRSKPKGGKEKKRKGKGMVHFDQAAKKKRLSKLKADFQDEEISSEEDDAYVHNERVETDEEEFLTPQEKKLKLAKKYLKEIEEEEKAKQDLDEVGGDVILDRLKEDVLSQAGRLRRKVFDKIKTEYNDCDINVLKCKEHKLSITCVAVSNDFHIFTGSKDSSIVKWSLAEMKKVSTIPPKHKSKHNENLHSTTILSLAVSHDNKYLASADENPVIQMWDAQSLAHLFSFKGHRAGVTGLAFCRHTNTLYSSSRDRTVKVWNVLERAYVETLFGHQNPITDLDVLSKDRAVTSGGVDGTVRVWKIQEESQLIFNGHGRSIDSVRRLDDRHFVTCGDEGSLCLWSVLKKKALLTKNPAHGMNEMSKEPYWITAVGCIPNTEIFASGSSNGQIQIWRCDDNYKGASVLTTIPIVGFVNSLVFSSDQKYLIAGIGQEHRLGRWSRIKEAKNSVLVINIQKSE